jgi:hypothetical protein
MRQTPRTRRQVSESTLNLARKLGFRYDVKRDAYILRGIGNRVGPVLRTAPPVDSAAESLEWSETMDELATVKRDVVKR